MRRFLVGLVLLLLVGGLAMAMRLDGTPEQRGAGLAGHDTSPPAITRALAGTWERMPGASPWIRLVVQDVRSKWADVRVAWCRRPKEPCDQWVRARAKVMPQGRLHLSSPFRMTFTLSEDWHFLVGTRMQLDPTAPLLLTRTGTENTFARALPLPGQQ